MIAFFATWLGNLIFYHRIGTLISLLLVTPVCVALYETLLSRDSLFFFGIRFVGPPLAGVRSHRRLAYLH